MITLWVNIQRLTSYCFRSSLTIQLVICQYASTTQGASSPVDRVRRFGIVTVYSGIMYARLGHKSAASTEYLAFSCISQTVAHWVTSDPVPAVVGTAKIGITEGCTK